MYTILKYVLIAICGIFGVLMALIPQKTIRKDWRDNPAKIKQTRLLGVIMIMFCIILFI